MTADNETRKRIDGGESQSTEFKRSLAQQKAGFGSLCAMLNTESGTGTVFFGVNPDGSAHGIEPGNRDTAQRTLARTVRAGFSPGISPDIRLHCLDGKDIISVGAQRPREVPCYSFHGKAYIREGTTTRELTRDEVERLKRRRSRNLHGGPWKCDKCGTVVGLLISTRITDRGAEPCYDCECGGEFWPFS